MARKQPTVSGLLCRLEAANEMDKQRVIRLGGEQPADADGN